MVCSFDLSGNGCCRERWSNQARYVWNKSSGMSGIFISKLRQAKTSITIIMWRCLKRLPERGRIGIFNRSYYEETLVVRVHEEILEKAKTS